MSSICIPHNDYAKIKIISDNRFTRIVVKVIDDQEILIATNHQFLSILNGLLISVKNPEYNIMDKNYIFDIYELSHNAQYMNP